MKNKTDGNFLSRVLWRIPIPAFVIDHNHSVTHWNMALENLTGCLSADMIGRSDHWKAFYATKRPLLADLVVDSVRENVIDGVYEGMQRKSSCLTGAYEVEDFFPLLGDEGKWLFFTATPIRDDDGTMLGAVQTLQDVTERKKVEDDLRESEKRYRERSITDSLTKLYNSRHFFHQLRYEIGRATRYEEPLSLILLDIDNFKGYNDTYGHMEGDHVLSVLAEVIRHNLRSADTAFRYGGEEFTIILPETEGANALMVAERLRKGFEGTVLTPLPRSEVHMTVSVGVAQYRADEQEEMFIKRADKAMYSAKTSGKNRVCLAK
ncbi:MAG TPA: diguanylate cyclase [Geobacteraceae bacterium]|nr:diguanylate cyclase [Geobacteraceae bacterium]